MNQQNSPARKKIVHGIGSSSWRGESLVCDLHSFCLRAFVGLLQSSSAEWYLKQLSVVDLAEAAAIVFYLRRKPNLWKQENGVLARVWCDQVNDDYIVARRQLHRSNSAYTKLIWQTDVEKIQWRRSILVWKRQWKLFFHECQSEYRLSLRAFFRSNRVDFFNARTRELCTSVNRLSKLNSSACHCLGVPLGKQVHKDETTVGSAPTWILGWFHNS